MIFCLSCFAATIEPMAKARSTIGVLLLFLWTAVPVVRCMIPGETLTSEEQACCKSMGGQCWDSPASDHPCCKRKISTVQPTLATAQSRVTTPVSMASSLPAAVYSLVEREFAQQWLFDPSPPPHRVLRI